MNIFQKATWCKSKCFSQNEEISCREHKTYIQKVRGVGGFCRSCKDIGLQHFWSSWDNDVRVSRLR